MGHVVVTGGAGYIGSFTVRALQQAGETVTVLDNLLLGHLPAIPRGADFIHVDLCNANLLRDVFARLHCNGVIHFAALTQVPESAKEPSKYWDTNLIGTKNLLDAMVGASVKKIVFSSTAAAYGIPKQDTSTGIVEDFPKAPINTYGETKLAMEALIRSYARARGMRAFALRYFNACGAAADGSMGEDHSPESHLLPLVVAAGLGIVDEAKGYKGAITVAGTDYPTPDGTCIRDYIDVRDLAAAHVSAYKQLDKTQDGHSEAMNVGTGKGHSVREVITAVNDVLKVEGKEVRALFGERRPGDPPILVANSDRLQRTLGWKPQFTLEDSIRAVVAWMKMKPLGYER